MIGPMKRKVITSSVITAVILIIIFAVISFIFISNNSKKIAELKQKGEVVQRYVFTKDLTAGSVITSSDVKLVDVKGESAPVDSYDSQNASMIGRMLKVNAKNKTIVADSLFFEEDKMPDIDTRMQEFNMITLPSTLNEGDYIDIRMRFPTGEDYSVLVGKKIEGFGSAEDSNTIFLKLNEEEIIRMASAVIDSYINEGINLYAIKYIDPSNQLFEYNEVDLVAKYEASKTAKVDEPVLDEFGEVISTSQKEITRTNEEIAKMLNVNVSDIEAIENALEKNDSTTLDYYKNMVVTVEKSIQATYPVKTEVATLIASNPNILEEVRKKYDVEALRQKRDNLLSSNLKTTDAFTGEETVNGELVSRVKERLDREINTQRTERQEYLRSLLSNSNTLTEEE